jgi:hypothetical protein
MQFMGIQQKIKPGKFLLRMKKIIISIGFLSEKNEFIYIYSTASGMKNGRSKNLKDIRDIIKILEVKDASDK